jgi:nicotinamide-nucleotide adenylyltransferase
MFRVRINIYKYLSGDVMKKAFGLGVLVGRFQTLHSGHEMMIDTALKLCDEVGVFVGSSQESGTYKNPFSYEQREMLLRKIYGEKISVYPLPDIGVGNNSLWGDYVLENIVERFGKNPDLLVSGKEGRRSSWFGSLDGLKVCELYIPKTIDISASEMRDYFINGDFENWKKYTNPALWDEFSKLGNIVNACKDVLKTDSI